MGRQNPQQLFLDAIDAWACDGYALDVRYIAEVSGARGKIQDALILLNPLPPARDNNLQASTSQFAIGQLQEANVSRAKVNEIVRHALGGILEIHDRTLTLDSAHGPLSYTSEMSIRDRWFSELHLQVAAGSWPVIEPIDLASADNALRASTPPFDGLKDIAAWLGLREPGKVGELPTISLRVGPPVDLIFSDCTLSNDELKLTLHAHPGFDVTRMALSVRGLPGDGLKTRRRVEKDIEWRPTNEVRRTGQVKVPLENADNALAMLLIEEATVRRQWFIDPAKARNNRLLAVQHFDNDLRVVRSAVLEGMDSSKFEHGVAVLLFLLGFSPCVQLETNAPDLIVSTPEGKLVLVECTTRIADFPAKVGKPVDRRGALSKYLVESGHPTNPLALLVCRLPRDRISALAADLAAHNVVLLTQEHLLAAFDRVRLPNDPDRQLETAFDGLIEHRISSN